MAVKDKFLLSDYSRVEKVFSCLMPMGWGGPSVVILKYTYDSLMLHANVHVCIGPKCQRYPVADDVYRLTEDVGPQRRQWLQR